MSDMMLDDLLKMRAVPEVPEGLSARIVAAAARQGQDMPVMPIASKGLWADLQAIFYMPRAVRVPAMAFAVLIVFALGLQMGASFSMNDTSALDSGDLASFMEIEDNFVAGDWV